MKVKQILNQVKNPTIFFYFIEAHRKAKRLGKIENKKGVLEQTYSRKMQTAGASVTRSVTKLNLKNQSIKLEKEKKKGYLLCEGLSVQ